MRILKNTYQKDGIINDVVVPDKKTFMFVFPGDGNCKVEITYDSQSGVAITQDYADGRAPETDDISLSGFLGYLLPRSVIRLDQKQQLENGHL